MTFLSTPALRCGGPQNLPHSTVLNAGPLSALLEQGELRRVMLGNVEVVRRVYVGLRGPDWAAIPAVISELKIQANGQDFSVSYVVQNKQGDFDFTWKIFIGGNPSGQIEFRADGTSHGNFKYNRASICVLHPLRECIGKKMQWRDSQGLPHEGQFPESINPHQPFLNTESILYELQPGLKLSLKYTGDEFEMEDQRNWSDGSFKTYSPPQARPKPFQATVGWKTSQTVSLDLLGSLPPINQNSGLVIFKVNAENITHLPHIGFGVSSAHRRSSAKDI